MDFKAILKVKKYYKGKLSKTINFLTHPNLTIYKEINLVKVVQ